jgi:hypothetical protein
MDAVGIDLGLVGLSDLDENGGLDLGLEEFVVHTAVIHKGTGVDQVVVASTSRVVVTYLNRKPGG